jgi:hypothetical protein
LRLDTGKEIVFFRQGNNYSESYIIFPLPAGWAPHVCPLARQPSAGFTQLRRGDAREPNPPCRLHLNRSLPNPSPRARINSHGAHHHSPAASRERARRLLPRAPHTAAAHRDASPPARQADLPPPLSPPLFSHFRLAHPPLSQSSRAPKSQGQRERLKKVKTKQPPHRSIATTERGGGAKARRQQKVR